MVRVMKSSRNEMFKLCIVFPRNLYAKIYGNEKTFELSIIRVKQQLL